MSDKLDQWQPDVKVLICEGRGYVDAKIVGDVEGWTEVRFSDGSTAIVRPSRLTERNDHGQ